MFGTDYELVGFESIYNLCTGLPTKDETMKTT